MENNIFAPCTRNKKGKVLFYVFEIAAAALCLIYFIFGIVRAARWSDFGTFVDCFATGLFNTLVLFGFGKIIDLLSCKHDCKTDKETKKEDKE